MNDNKISKNRQRKAVVIAELSEKAMRAKAVVFTNYQGMTHRQLEALKKGLKQTNADLLVAKNTLLGRALQISNFIHSTSSGQESQISNLHGPTATIFAYEDVVAPLKELAKSIKMLKLPQIKFGLFEGKQLTNQDVMRLATLPSREVLIAQFVGSLKSPIYGLHRALSWNLQKLVMTLKAIEKTKTS